MLYRKLHCSIRWNADHEFESRLRHVYHQVFLCYYVLYKSPIGSAPFRKFPQTKKGFRSKNRQIMSTVGSDANADEIYRRFSINVGLWNLR
jgi:hypothetical protein